MRLDNCLNFKDFRKLAKKKLPSPVFHYIDGAADDEVTYRRNTSAFDDVDLIPNVLRGVKRTKSTNLSQGQWIESNHLLIRIEPSGQPGRRERRTGYSPKA